MAETMTPKQRVMAAIDRQVPDRVPAVPRTTWFGLKYAGHTIRDCYEDEDVYVRAQVACVEELGVDVAWANGGAQNVLERFLGQPMVESDDDPAAPAEPLINSEADLDALPKNPKVKDSHWFRYMASVVGKLRKTLGDDICLIPAAVSPFRCACMLRGTQNLYLDMYENPDFVKRLIDYCTQPMTDLAEMVADAGAEIVLTACPVGSRTMISRKHYLEFVHPVHQALYSDWEKRIGLRVLFHICGDWSDRVDLVADEGVSVLYMDKTDLGKAKGLVGDRVAVMGNVSSTGTILLGTPDEVEQEALGCIKQAAAGGGYLLGDNCVVPRDAPAENVRAIVRAAQKYGVYGAGVGC